MTANKGEEQRYEQLRQAGFTRLDTWEKAFFKEEAQKALLAAIAPESKTTKLK